MELEITWKRAVAVWWAYLWRNLIVIAIAMIIGGIIGGMLGYIMEMLGASVETIRSISIPLGAIIGLAISIIPVKMILGKDFGEFRLVLVKKDSAINSLISLER
jgi:hypothetical protein